jgi:hypothetical protein
MGYGMVWRHRSTWETHIFTLGGGADFVNTLRFFSFFLSDCTTITTTTTTNAVTLTATGIQPPPRTRTHAHTRARSLNKGELPKRYKSIGIRDSRPPIHFLH